MNSRGSPWRTCSSPKAKPRQPAISRQNLGDLSRIFGRATRLPIRRTPSRISEGFHSQRAERSRRASQAFSVGRSLRLHERKRAFRSRREIFQKRLPRMATTTEPRRGTLRESGSLQSPSLLSLRRFGANEEASNRFRAAAVGKNTLYIATIRSCG